MSPIAGPVTALECDVLIVGSGAGGLAAAVTAAHRGLNVLVAERATVCGGATSWSGGWMWTPGSFFADPSGSRNDLDEFRAYLRSCLGDLYESEPVDAFLQAAPEMVSFFHQNTALQFVPGTHVRDIYGGSPGAGTGNRSVAPKPINARRLSKAVRRRMRGQLYETSFLGMGIMAGKDLSSFLAASQLRPGGLIHAGRRVALHLLDLILHGRGMQLVNGTALVGRLLASAEQTGVRIETDFEITRLRTDGTGRVCGADGMRRGQQTTVSARRGVVLATGGFPQNRALRAELFPRTPTGREHWSLAPAEADGAGIRLAQEVGAAFRSDVASPAAWCPVSLVPYRSGRVGIFPHIMDRAKPGSIGVLTNGRRFVNEANGYYDYVAAMIASAPQGQQVQAWQIADATFVRKYPFGMAKPFPVPLWPYLRSGYLVSAPTLAGLATKCGIDPDELEDTVREFNRHATQGEDPHFHRGETPFNQYGGDPRVTPNPSLAPLSKSPFYAVRVLPGSFGTFAGLASDARARVVDDAGRPIPGLYVAGNDRASIMRGFYPSGGINLGPAMVFGYIAGRELAEASLERKDVAHDR